MSKIIPHDKKDLIKFIKSRYPIGSEIIDPVRSGYFTIRKTSVFEVREWDYSDEYKPDNENDVYLDFLVRKPGKHTDLYSVETIKRKWAKLTTNNK